ncbi:histidinol-phosphate aminotransferase [Arboricoccus pini]|uniref:Histidinol-phosphate aminotransferase n=1 Tax=Arboricoccus pini TaxID=1963835 RepID=A0A212Q619_9PROT|nr:histidinol-phosphate transaminase [Arboricoccus pini]SNB54748.1 histidinol-phosphate aminotransferase [Arboricoccus pini]
MSSFPQPRPGILEITPYVGGKGGSGDRANIAKLSANENPLGPSPHAIEAYQATAASLHRYPEGGSETLTQAIARRFDLDPSRIICGAGSDELIAVLIRAYAGPGDEVLTSRHGFLMYKLAALAAGAHVIEAPETELRSDVDALLQRVTSRTRILFIANPNNPTGSFIDGAELTRLHAALPPHVILAVDAAYAEYAEGTPGYDSGLSLANQYENVVSLRTFSKLFGLAALRLGWLFGPKRIVDTLHRVRGPFNVSLPAQAAGIAALSDLAHQAAARAHNDRWLPWVKQELEGLGLKVWPSLGNFLLIEFPRRLGQDAVAAEAFLEAAGVIPRGMGSYGLGHCLRISIGTEAENRRLVQVLGAFQARHTLPGGSDR